MRGAPADDDPAAAARRIIPAYAGSTASWPETETRSPDHPRIRGEHLTGLGLGGMIARIIPAYAGSTPTTGMVRSSLWDHPRIRGEHFWAWLIWDANWGSSPHTRGARF